MLSLVRAVLLASLAALPTSLLFFALEGSVIRGFGWIGAVVWILIFAVLGCIVIGLPIHFVLRKRNHKSRLAYALAGFAAPLVILASGPIVFLDWEELVNPNNIEPALVFAVAGAAVALALREILD